MNFRLTITRWEQVSYWYKLGLTPGKNGSVYPLNADRPLFVVTEAGQRTSVQTGHGNAERPLTTRSIHRLVGKYANRAVGKGDTASTRLR